MTNIHAALQDTLPELIYYDADSITIKQNLNVYELNSSASFMMGDLFLSADKIIIEKSDKFITAEGHVKIIYKNTQALASKILYDGNTKQLRMDDAKIYSDPQSKANIFDKEALGFSSAEIAFEETRKVREKEILKELAEIQISYANLKNIFALKKEEKIHNKLIAAEKKYSELLAHYMRIASEPNTIFANLSEKDKTKYLERRAAFEKFNRDHPDMAEKILNFSAMPSYIFVAASQILQKDDDTYLLNETFITPCNCGTSKVPPIFGFSAKKAKLDLGNYVTMEGSTLDFFKVPIFYLPWSKLSIKSKRETGFLYPSGYLSNNAGFAVSFPFFLTLGDHADATTVYQYFSQRGSRLSESLRWSLFENSTFYVGGNTAFDRLYPVQWAENKQNVQNSIIETELDPDLTPAQKIAKIKQYNGFIGEDLQNRWYAETTWNIPIFNVASFKLNGQVVSDNTYISDYESSTNVDPKSTVYGNTTPASRRFLNQEIDAEYYGNHVVLSARNTRYQDLFALTQNESPISLPLVEFTLLPGNYFKLPLTIANKSAFEDIIGSQTIKGKRFASSTYFVLNLPYNDYISSYLQLQETFVQYYATSAIGASNTNPDPYEVYSRFSLRTEIPFYAISVYKNKKTESEISVQNNYKPFIDLSYIPTVTRSSSFPYTYQLWYAADNATKLAMISTGVEWSLDIKKKISAERKKISDTLRSQVADTKILGQVLKENKNFARQSNDEMYILPTDLEATEIYMQWAQIELSRFYDEMESLKFNQTYFVPNVSDDADFGFTPLRFKIFSNYNIIADQTANELNELAGPIFSPKYLPERFGDISAQLNWNLLPFVGWDGAVLYSYSVVYGRLNTLTASTNLALAYGFAGMARYQILYSAEPPSVTAPIKEQPDFFKKTFLNFGLSYTPKPYIKFGFEWAKNTDPTLASTTDLTHGRQYGSSFYINFLNLQDCLDIIIARNKPAGIPERQATYSIGVNIKFFGHSMRFNQIGNYFNSKLQN